MAERDPFPQWYDLVWIPVLAFSMFWFFACLANWLNGFGWGMQ